MSFLLSVWSSSHILRSRWTCAWWVLVLEGVKDPLLLGAGWGHGYAWAGLPPGLLGPVAWPAVCSSCVKWGAGVTIELPVGPGLPLLLGARDGRL